MSDTSPSEIDAAPARDQAISDMKRMREAHTVIANWPITAPLENMDAANMAIVARQALASIPEKQGDNV